MTSLPKFSLVWRALTDIVLLAEGYDGGVIRLVDGDCLDTLLDVDARIARGAVEVVARRRLPQPPAQRVLTSAAAHDKHVDLVAGGGGCHHGASATARRGVDHQNAALARIDSRRCAQRRHSGALLA